MGKLRLGEVKQPVQGDWPSGQMGVESLRVSWGKLRVFERCARGPAASQSRAGPLFPASQPPPARVLPVERNWRITEGSREGQTHSAPLASHAPGLPGTGMRCWPPACLPRLRPKPAGSADPVSPPSADTGQAGAKAAGCLLRGDGGQGRPTASSPGASRNHLPGWV